MDELSAWRAQWMADLLSHLASAIDPLLPAGHHARAAALQVVLSSKDGSYRTFDVSPPVDGAELGAVTAAYTLRDLQDEVALHLGSAWPVAEDGVSLHGRADDEDGDRIALAFVGRAGEALPLSVFEPPRRPETGLRAE